MASVGESQFVYDCGDTLVGIGEQRPGLVQIYGLAVFQDRLPGIFLDNPVQIFPVIVQLWSNSFPACSARGWTS